MSYKQRTNLLLCVFPVNARTAKKIVMLGSKFSEELLKEVDPSMLPKP